MRKAISTIIVGLYATSAQLAIAQSTETTTEADAVGDDQSQGQSQPAGGSAAAYGTIVVTAQRREQDMQDVPIAITAISAAGLERQGITGTGDLDAIVPGLSMAKTSTVVQPFLRGVGTASLVPGNDPSVPLYIDGVYHSAPAALLFSFNNIERIEVLRGPQGTLFGRNATGGLVQVITRDPTPELSGNFSLGYGNYDTVQASGYVSGGSDTVAAGVAMFYRNQSNGWGENLYEVGDGGPIIVGGQPVTERPPLREAGFTEEFGLHANVLMTADDLTTIRLSGMYIDVDTNQNHYRRQLPGVTVPGPDGGPYQFTGDFHDYNSDIEWRNQNSQYLLSATATHEADFATLKSITSYLTADAAISVPSDASPTITRANSVANLFFDTFTQEFQLLSNDQSGPDWLEWIVGFYYLNSTAGYDPQRVTYGRDYDGLFDRYSSQTSDSLAGYAQATFDITDSTRLTLGGRYTHDRLAATQYQQGTSVDLGGSFALGAVSILLPKVETTFDNFSWRIGVDQRLSDDVLLYATASRGYKTGAWNHGALCGVTFGQACTQASIVPPTRPEVLDAYEVGLKTDLFDRRVRFNISGYYYDYSDLQVQAVVGVPPISILTNAATARIYGIDLETAFQVTDNLRLSFNAAYVNGRYRSFPGAIGFAQRTTAPYANAQFTFDATGNELPRAPEFTSTFAVDWVIPTSIGDFTLTSSWYHNGGFFWESQNILAESAYDLVNAQVSYQATDALRFRVWGRNLLNEEYYSYQTATSAGNQGAPAAPLTFGAAVDFEF